MSALLGIVAGVALVIFGIMLDGDIMSFWNVPSIVIVLGGTLAAVTVSFSPKKMIAVFKYTKNVFTSKPKDFHNVINSVVELATHARKEGLLSLEDTAHSISDPFFKKGLLLIVDATDPELVKNIMETDLYYLDERHKEGQAVYEMLAAVAPAFGMIGTLIGLINMLKNLNDPSSLGPSMAVALITTFYGSMLANLIFTPIATQLKYLSDKEITEKTIILEGLLSIQAGENPRIIQEKLESFLPMEQKPNVSQGLRAGESE